MPEKKSDAHPTDHPEKETASNEEWDVQRCLKD
jgi:hypothetical protein